MLAGVVVAVRSKMTARGRMAFVMLDDNTAQLEVAIGNELFMQQQALLKEDQLLIVEGQVRNDDYTGGLRVNARKLFDLASARTSAAQFLRLSCRGNTDVQQLRGLLAPHLRQEACRVLLHYRNENAGCEFAFPDNWRVDLSEVMIENLKSVLNPENVEILY